MRVLVVDDEFVSRKKMEKIMVSFGQCVAVDSGKEALKTIEEAIEKGTPFDLITLDISMPEMDGTEVLYEARKIEEQKNIPKKNRSKVIMVTAESDKDTVITCMQAGCDSYVIKPFDRTIMAKRMAELGMIAAAPVAEGQSIRNIVMETISKFNNGQISMPVLPQITKEIEAVINKPNADMEELVKIIERDAVISVKIIATSNSALYRGVDQVRDLRTAIARLGAKESQSIVNAIANKNMYKSKNKQFRELLNSLWLNSLATAFCCRAISVQLGERDSGKVFLMGLTHKIGCVVLLKSIGDITPDKIIYDKTELMECLNEVHTSFGTAILTDLGFDREFAEVVRLHKWSSFEKGTSKEVLIVNLADKMASIIQCGFFESDADLTNLESAIALGFDEATLKKIAEDVNNAMKGIESVFM